MRLVRVRVYMRGINQARRTTSAHGNRRTKCSEIRAAAAEHVNVRDDLVDPSWGNESYLPKAEKLRGRGLGVRGVNSRDLWVKTCKA